MKLARKRPAIAPPDSAAVVMPRALTPPISGMVTTPAASTV